MTQWIATFFGLGYCPIAPGTAGTLGGVLIFLAMTGTGLGIVAQLLLIGIIFFLGVWSSDQFEKSLKSKDPSCVVIDEVVGFLITMLTISPTWKIIFVGFILNRVLDIWKPFPADRIQRLPGGWGIMADDAVSSVYANLILQFITRVIQ